MGDDFSSRRTEFSPLQQPSLINDEAREMSVPMEDLLRLVTEEKASDLHLTVGSPPAVRIGGKLTKLELSPLTAGDMENLARSVANEKLMKKVEDDGSVDFAISFAKMSRFRINIYRQKGYLGLAARLLPNELLTPEEIGLPDAVTELLNAPRGLVLVTGPTGSGKTTTLASMLNVINTTKRSHIVTIEDPIEYYHEHQRGIINQREVGVDCPSFAEGLRRALRQDPDVIFVGEMRDLETMETAIRAAETGHLVFSTLHTTGAARTVDRIVDAFPAEQQEQVRVQLAGNLRAVISQLLIPRRDGKGRVATFEVMINTPSIAAMVRENKTFRIGSDIQTGAKYGMISLEAHLVQLYLDGIIEYDEVMNWAQDREGALQLMGDRKPR